MSVREAVRAAMIEPLTDEPDVRAALLEIADAMIR
jgi:nitric oxide reductase NorQ protein